ncbi:diaminopimelate decarboxylase [Dehalogenimonas lykanthroporepellens BL-DC-9]|nr:diaminopimelate decarboxylase [Dehalogenimonas lykanthroporepellens BL-DC-9]
MNELSKIFPSNASVSAEGQLLIDGVGVESLASEFGTPLYIFSEQDFRDRCREYNRVFKADFSSDLKVLFAGKAWLNLSILKIIAEEGIGLDVVSEGELGIASAAGFPLDRIYMHGNNKSDRELELAVEKGIGRIVVDNQSDISRLEAIASEKKDRPAILVRINPGIDPHTHAKISTGNIDSKFGMGLEEARDVIDHIIKSDVLDLKGFHYHIGSQIFEIQPFLDALTTALAFISDLMTDLDYATRELDIGGGYAIPYLSEQNPPGIGEYAKAISDHFDSECQRLKLQKPCVTIEPGRSLIASSTVALYTVGVIKRISGIRDYVCVDGGMADNIRPTLYGAQYEPSLANRMNDSNVGKYTVAGRYCESGDILATDVSLPEPKTGDLLVMPGAGAYCLPMASNYNASFRPAVVKVHQGKATLIRRRETMEDLIRYDIRP